MSLPREERLKALGMWPVWRLREGGVEADAVAPVSSCASAPLAPKPEAGAAARERAVGGDYARPPDLDQADIADMDWDALRQTVESCTRCQLHESRSKAVFGVGDVAADWLIVGEAPGAEEDRQGEPFVGQAGKLLDAMLAAIGQKRGDNVYIANILKSRPPGNRDPKPDEVAACIPYLERQIDLIRPRIILAMGRFAAQSLLLTEASISSLRGRVHEYRGVAMVVTYHPAYLLRNPADKAKVWEDLCLARNTLLSSQSKSNTGD
ncbi:MAG: uracil-DNA glycosylase [Gallionellaceae bacterium]|nr:uracil-DNA glycosylase [Gallionellaceae bacterium]